MCEPSRAVSPEYLTILQQRYAQSDGAAHDELWELYYVCLRHHALSYASGDPEAADCGLAITYQQLQNHQATASYDPTVPWVRFALHHLRLRVIDCLRQHYRRRRREVTLNPEPSQAMDDAPEGALMREEEVAQTAATLQQMQQCLGRLDPHFQEMLRRRFEDGATLQEVADEFGYSRPAGAWNRINSLLQRLKQCLEDFPQH